MYVEDAEGRRLAKARLPEGVEGLARFHDLVAPLSRTRPTWSSRSTVLTDRGLFVGALVAAGYSRDLAVNLMSTSRYRERHSTWWGPSPTR